MVATMLPVWLIVGGVGGVSIIGHMTNTPESVRWALERGANGVELDLQFDGRGRPEAFQHTRDASLDPCDCTCLCPLAALACPAESVCKALVDGQGRHCRAGADAGAMASFLADESLRSRLAVVYIDAKLGDKTAKVTDLAAAGANVVRLLNENLMARGYRGQVILDGNYVRYVDFLKGALNEARSSQYADRFFYALGSAGGGGSASAALQQLGTANVASVVGVSACFPRSFMADVKRGVASDVGYASVGVWTVDSASAVRRYVAAGADLILTNRPGVAAAAVGGAGALAAPGLALVAKTGAGRQT